MKRGLWLALFGSIFLIAGCSSSRTPAPLATVTLNDNVSALTQTTPSADGTSAARPSSGVSASGVLVSDQNIELAFQTSGIVQQVNAALGESVVKGDVLAVLDNTELQSRLDQANLVLSELTSPLAISNARKAVAEDRSALDHAQGTYYWWLEVASQKDLITKAKADLVVAEDKLKKAQEDYDKLSADLYSDKDKATLYQHLFDAQQKVKEAKSKVDLYNGPDPFQFDIYKADMDVAQAKVNEDETLLAVLTGGELPTNPTGDGYAQIIQARISIKQAQSNLDASQLISPIDGIISAIDLSIGDSVPAGQIQIRLIDPNHLHVETTDLSERDIPGIKADQTVDVNIIPLNQIVTGKVIAISPQANSLGGDVVYKVIIRLDNLPEKAFSGMSVTVNFTN